MKKYLFLLFALFSLVACEKDDDKNGNGNGGIENLSEAAKAVQAVDYSSALGMSKSNVLSKYGEPAMQYGTFYMYQLEDDKYVEMVMLALNPSNDKVYNASVVLKEDVMTEDAIKEYLSSLYTCYGYDEDAEVYTYGNDKDKAKATITVSQSGANAITWTDVNNVPEEEEGSDDEVFAELTPKEAVSLFLGMSEEDLIENYGKSLANVGEGIYMANVENDYLMAVGITVSNGKVANVTLLFNEDLEDADVIAYYEGLGFTANPCGADDNGAEVYLFMNMTTGEMFTYADLVANFMDLSDIGGDDDEDYDDED